jgi:hypothetical protein
VQKVLRISRYILNAAAAGLCVVIVAVWVASYFRSDEVTHLMDARRASGARNVVEARWLCVGCDNGRLRLSHLVNRTWPDYPSPLGYRGLDWSFDWSVEWVPDNAIWRAFGSGGMARCWSNYCFHLVHERRGSGEYTYEERGIKIPLWALLLPPLLLTLFVIRAYRRKRRWTRLGYCVKRGYDLRASKDTCPECGTPFVRAASSSPAPKDVA